jgi:outer membrane protein assembly factor BamB
MAGAALRSVLLVALTLALGGRRAAATYRFDAQRSGRVQHLSQLRGGDVWQESELQAQALSAPVAVWDHGFVIVVGTGPTGAATNASVVRMQLEADSTLGTYTTAWMWPFPEVAVPTTQDAATPAVGGQGASAAVYVCGQLSNSGGSGFFLVGLSLSSGAQLFFQRLEGAHSAAAPLFLPRLGAVAVAGDVVGVRLYDAAQGQLLGQQALPGAAEVVGLAAASTPPLPSQPQLLFVTFNSAPNSSCASLAVVSLANATAATLVSQTCIDAQGAFADAPVAASSAVVLAYSNNTLFGVDLATPNAPRVAWSFGAAGSGVMRVARGCSLAPAVTPAGTVYVLARNGNVSALDGGTGALLWTATTPFSGAPCLPPITDAANAVHLQGLMPVAGNASRLVEALCSWREGGVAVGCTPIGVAGPASLWPDGARNRLYPVPLEDGSTLVARSGGALSLATVPPAVSASDAVLRAWRDDNYTVALFVENGPAGYQPDLSLPLRTRLNVSAVAAGARCVFTVHSWPPVANASAAVYPLHRWASLYACRLPLNDTAVAPLLLRGSSQPLLLDVRLRLDASLTGVQRGANTSDLALARVAPVMVVGASPASTSLTCDDEGRACEATTLSLRVLNAAHLRALFDDSHLFCYAAAAAAAAPSSTVRAPPQPFGFSGVALNASTGALTCTLPAPSAPFAGNVCVSVVANLALGARLSSCGGPAPVSLLHVTVTTREHRVLSRDAEIGLIAGGVALAVVLVCFLAVRHYRAKHDEARIITYTASESTATAGSLYEPLQH